MRFFCLFHCCFVTRTVNVYLIICCILLCWVRNDLIKMINQITRRSLMPITKYEIIKTRLSWCLTYQINKICSPIYGNNMHEQLWICKLPIWMAFPHVINAFYKNTLISLTRDVWKLSDFYINEASTNNTLSFQNYDCVTNLMHVNIATTHTQGWNRERDSGKNIDRERKRAIERLWLQTQYVVPCLLISDSSSAFRGKCTQQHCSNVGYSPFK